VIATKRARDKRLSARDSWEEKKQDHFDNDALTERQQRPHFCSGPPTLGRDGRGRRRLGALVWILVANSGAERLFRCGALARAVYFRAQFLFHISKLASTIHLRYSELHVPLWYLHESQALV
jgi:hypothetical protein